MDGGSLLAGLVHPGASCIDPTSYPAVQQPTHTDLTRLPVARGRNAANLTTHFAGDLTLRHVGKL